MEESEVDVSPVLAALLEAAGLPAVRSVVQLRDDGYGLDNRLTVAELLDGRLAVLRQSRVETRSPRVRIDFLRGNGVPTPILYAVGQAGAALWEYVPGRPLADAMAEGDANETIWENAGAALARIHAVSFPPPLQGDIGPEAVTLRPLDPVDELIANVAGSRAWVAQHRPLLSNAMVEVERFITRRASDIRRAHPVITHGDVNLLNIVVSDDDSVHFIDWDFPKVRYPMAEISALDEHAYLHGLDGLPPAFFRGYGGDVPADLLLAYRIVGCVGWLASDDWSGWHADTTMPAAARVRLSDWHDRLLDWADRIPDLVSTLA